MGCLLSSPARELTTNDAGKSLGSWEKMNVVNKRTKVPGSYLSTTTSILVCRNYISFYGHD